MRKQTRYIPPAFKHGVYSGIGLLPTEDPAEFRKVKQKIFDELALAGPLEEGIGEHMACLLWRMQNLSTYSLADRARERRGLIYAKLCPSNGTMLPLLQPETRNSEELAALYKSADHQARTELGAAVELVEIGEVATVEYLERELALVERLNGMLTRAFKSLLYVRGIKSMSSSAAVDQPRLGKVA